MPVNPLPRHRCRLGRGPRPRRPQAPTLIAVYVGWDGLAEMQDDEPTRTRRRTLVGTGVWR